MEIECPHEQNDHCPASELERCDCCWKWIHLQDLQQAVIEHLIHPPLFFGLFGLLQPHKTGTLAFSTGRTSDSLQNSYQQEATCRAEI